MTKAETPAPIGHNNPPVDDKFLAKIATQMKAVGRRLADQKALATASKKTREDWFTFGTLLADAREVMPSNNVFNSWLKEHELDGYADRNARTDAMWLTTLTDEMLDLVPDTIHSPKAIRAWYRAELKDAVAASDGDKTKAGKTETYGAFVAAMIAEDWDIYKAKYEADKNKVPYNELPAADAAVKVLARITAHDHPGDLWAALVAAVEAGALEPEPEKPANDPEGDADFDAGDDTPGEAYEDEADEEGED